MSALAQRYPDVSTAAGRWLSPLRHWPGAALRLLEQETSVVRVLVAAMRGSAPREAGACMLVSRDRVLGTVGGGYLEWEALRVAHGLLDGDGAAVQVRKLILGRELGQCCGGVVELWLERYTVADRRVLEAALGQREWRCSLQADGRVERTPADAMESAVSCAHSERGDATDERVQLWRGADGSLQLRERLLPADPPLFLYGAGHVGQALVRVLSALPFAVQWIDARPEVLPGDVPDNVTTRLTSRPLDTVAAAPAGACFVVMTHDHALDYALCRAILERGDFAFAGVIGSQSKAARFRSRLARDGLSDAQIERLVCPIGIDGIVSKQPAAIAVAVAAQLLRLPGSVTASADAHAPQPIEICSPEGCARCPQTLRAP